MPAGFASTRRTFVAGGLSSASVLGFGSARRAHAATDVALVISFLCGSDLPFQKMFDAVSEKGLGVTAINRYDGAYHEAAAKALAWMAAGRAPDMMITGWKFGDQHRNLCPDTVPVLFVMRNVFH
ncbi:MAG: hypothetical protein H5U13_05055, partial [Parvibaculum sp.]|nr:hypothetical protein [Parvibaculum sp.]